ncbi:hypothetical protein BSR29_07930 [Boudabousia liubingyangii]|uniref:Uncharacterized protein n=1 Tax=Boudabousia liubingyangii TaxID=1921764 RepID=A0A1Q5PJQ0_9ACTO|nr:hypothetical protein [Boudabousia liubingyangii]OKL46171.1 hypothetical protein BSR29_07930 [Boudabousia liubingyangii]
MARLKRGLMLTLACATLTLSACGSDLADNPYYPAIKQDKTQTAPAPSKPAPTQEASSTAPKEESRPGETKESPEGPQTPGLNPQKNQPSTPEAPKPPRRQKHSSDAANSHLMAEALDAEPLFVPSSEKAIFTQPGTPTISSDGIIESQRFLPLPYSVQGKLVLVVSYLGTGSMEIKVGDETYELNGRGAETRALQAITLRPDEAKRLPTVSILPGDDSVGAWDASLRCREIEPGDCQTK